MACVVVGRGLLLVVVAVEEGLATILLPISGMRHASPGMLAVLRVAASIFEAVTLDSTGLIQGIARMQEGCKAV